MRLTLPHISGIRGDTARTAPKAFGEAIRALRVKEPPTTLLVDRDQRHEVGKAFGCSVRSRRALLRLRGVRSREAVPAFIESLASRLLWLACKVHINQSPPPLSFCDEHFGFRSFVVRISSRRAVAPSQRVGFRNSAFGFPKGNPALTLGHSSRR